MVLDVYVPTNHGRTPEANRRAVTLEIEKYKWEHVTMDFVCRLPRSNNGHEAIWVIVD